MNLAANASDRGYAMAALLVGMAVMAIMLSVAMPTWNQMIRREKEEELIFRGNQYARAINLYQRKFANANPPSIDVLVEQRLLRKKFKDPMNPEKSGEFQLLYLSNSAQPNAGSQMGAQTGRQGSGAQPGQGSGSGPGQFAGSTLGTTPTGGIAGVTSKNKSESLRIFNGKTHYNEWQFVGMQQSNQAGGAGGPAGRGGPGIPGSRPEGADPGRQGGGRGGRQGPGQGFQGPGQGFQGPGQGFQGPPGQLPGGGRPNPPPR